MVPVRRLLAFLLAASAVLADPSEFEKKMTAAAQKGSKEHTTLAKFCWSRKIHQVAMQEYQRAVDLDAENAEAQKGLGMKMVEGIWTKDLDAKVKRVNEGSDADIEKAKAAYEEKRKAAAAKIAKEYELVAEWAVKSAPESAKVAWEQVLEYDKDHAKARKALGFIKEDGRWVPPEDVAKREDGKKKVAAGDEGVPVTETTEIERQTGWSMVKRRSKHYFFETKLSDDETRQLLKTAEGARAAFLEAFELGPDDFPDEVHGVFVVSKYDHETFIDKCTNMDPSRKANYKNYGGYATFNPDKFFEVVQGGGDFAYLKDVACHDAIHQLFAQYAGTDFPWLDEGVAYYFTDRLLKSAATHCIDFALSGGGGGGKSWDNVLDWKGLIKEMIRENANPDLKEIMEGPLNSLTAKKGCKAWSVIDYVMTKRRKDFFKFIALTKEGVKQEEALKEAYGVSGYKEFDEQWIAFVKEAY